MLCFAVFVSGSFTKVWGVAVVKSWQTRGALQAPKGLGLLQRQDKMFNSGRTCTRGDVSVNKEVKNLYHAIWFSFSSVFCNGAPQLKGWTISRVPERNNFPQEPCVPFCALWPKKFAFSQVRKLLHQGSFKKPPSFPKLLTLSNL